MFRVGLAQSSANSGKPSNRAKNSSSQRLPARWPMAIGKGSCSTLLPGLNSNRPATPAAAIIATWAQAAGTSSTRQVAIAIREIRGTSGHRLRAMPQTAWATIATATTFKPWRMPAGTASA
ncbi:hypothetical protein D3C79_939570 [compost metagenome]